MKNSIVYALVKLLALVTDLQLTPYFSNNFLASAFCNKFSYKIPK